MTTKQPTRPPHPHVVRLRVSTEELEWLREEAADQQRSISNVLRLALRHYVEASK